MSTVTHSSGFNGLENSPLARIGYYNTILSHGWSKEFIPQITNTAITSKLLACNQVVQFVRQPLVGEWRDYEKDMELVPDYVTPEAFTMQVCNAAYKSLKFDKLDIMRICDRWESFEDSFLQSAYETLAQKFRKWVLGAMVLETAANNKGNSAGCYHNIDLGAPNAPVRITGANIAKELVRLRQVLVDARRWVDNEMFVVLPSQLMEVLVDSPYANMWQMGLQNETSMLITGLMPGKLMGFNVFIVDCLPSAVDATGDICYYIISGHRDAFAFVGDVIDGRLVTPEKYFAVLYQMFATWGGKALYPDALAVGYWTLGQQEK